MDDRDREEGRMMVTMAHSLQLDSNVTYAEALMSHKGKHTEIHLGLIIARMIIDNIERREK